MGLVDGGKIADRTNVIIVKVSGSNSKDVDVAVIKATNHNMVAPKEKHVMTLVSASRMGDQQLVHHICYRLSKRATSLKKWLIALKACVTYHRLIREAGPSFLTAASSSRMHGAQTLGLGNFRDAASNVAWDYAAFIRPYSIYLDQQVETFGYVQYYPEMESMGNASMFRQMEASAMVDQVPRVLKLIKCVTLCRPQKAALTSGVVQYAMVLVLKECILLYKSCSEAMLNIVDKFFDLEPAQASRLLTVYKDTIAANAQLVKFMLECKDSGISQGVDLPIDIQAVPEEFIKQMEEYASGKSSEPPIYETELKIESPKKEEPVEEEPPPTLPPPVAVAPPKIVEVPDLMVLDTPPAAEPAKTPFQEEEDDELGQLWKEPAPAGPSGAAPNGFGSSQTGFIPTKAFLAGPTGMLTTPGPFQAAPASNNPFLMPVPQPPPPPPQPAEPSGYAAGKGVTNVLGDLSVDALGIRKQKEPEPAKKSPMRQSVPTSLALPPPATKPAQAPAPVPAAPAPALKPAAPLIPPNPFYQAPPTGQFAGQQLALAPQHDPFAAHYSEGSGHAGATPGGLVPQPLYSGGVTGFNQAVAFGSQGGYYLPPTGQVPATSVPQPAPMALQGGFTGAPHQSAAFGATPTGMPALPRPQANQFRSSVTGPAPAPNPFGSNAF